MSKVSKKKLIYAAVAFVTLVSFFFSSCAEVADKKLSVNYDLLSVDGNYSRVQAVFDDIDYNAAIKIKKPLVEIADESVYELGEYKISLALYYYLLSDYKSGYIGNLKTQYGMIGSDTPEFWSTVYTADGKTHRQLLIEAVDNYCYHILTATVLFNELDLTSSGDYLATMENLEKNFGSKKLLAEYYAAYGLSLEELKQYHYMDNCYSDLWLYYFGDDGVEKLAEEELKNRMFSDYIRIKQILLPTIMISETATLTQKSDEDKAKAAQKADAIYERIKNGEYTFEQMMIYTEDGSIRDFPDGLFFTHGYTFESLENEVFAMADGEIRVIKSETGYHIVKKYPLTEDDAVEFREVLDTEIHSSMFNEKLSARYKDIVINENARTRYDIVQVISKS